MYFSPLSLHVEKTLKVLVPVSQRGQTYELVSVGDWIHILTENKPRTTLQVLYIQKNQLIVRYHRELVHVSPTRVIKLLPGEERLFV